MRLHRLILTTLLCFSWLTGFALDISSGPLPLRLTDNAITIGGRTLTLPLGDWTLVAQEKSNITLDEVPNSVVSTVYLVSTKNKKLVASVILTLPETSVSGAERMQWSGNPCELAKGYILRETFNSGFRTPACLQVYEHVNHLRGTSPLIVAAKKWLDDEGIETRAPYYYISYSKQADREFGRIHLFFPEKSVDFSAQVVNWANTLHEALARFFERRDTQATLASFPIQP